MEIPWDELDHEKYEKMVAVLLSRLHPESQRIDGSGGDGGRDVQIVDDQSGEITHVFQLKSVTGRMDSVRKSQVKRSLDRAAALQPAQWTLIVPIDPTPDEDAWFRKLGQDHSFPIRWCGRTWLDEKMSKCPDIRRYYLEGTDNEIVRLLRELNKEQAVLTDVPDAIDRLGNLRKRLNEIDPHYRYELSTGPEAASERPPSVAFSVSFGHERVDVYPKYTGANIDRPITICASLSAGPGLEEVRHALDYGSAVTVPSHLIGSVTVDAPSGLGGTFHGGVIQIMSNSKTLTEPLTLELDVLDGDDLVSSCPVHVTRQEGGQRGTIHFGSDISGWLDLRLTANAIDREFRIDFRLSPKPVLPSLLVPLCRWLSALQPPHELRIRWPNGPELKSAIAEDYALGQLSNVVEALAYLQDNSNRYWEMLPSLIDEKGHLILEAARLLRGETLEFNWDSLNLHPRQWSPGLGGLLSELLDGQAQEIIQERDELLELEEGSIRIGRVRTLFESARLDDPKAVRDSLDLGLARSLRLVPGSNRKAKRKLVG